MILDFLKGHEKSPTEIIEHHTKGGQSVILSREVLTTYGKKYIDQLAESSGKNRLLLADENVLNQAKQQFPDSKTPLIDMYPDYLPDSKDADIEAVRRGRDPSDFAYLNISKTVEESIEASIKNNAPSAISQPGGDASLIIMPSASSLKDNDFKDRITSGLAYVDTKEFGNMPGTSLDWAKYSLSHEVSHIANKDSERYINLLLDIKDEKALRADAKNLMSGKWNDEVRGDLSARRDFNIASRAPSEMPQVFTDLRVIGGVMLGETMTDYFDGNMEVHNDGNALQDIQDGRAPDLNAVHAQLTVAYTNTLVRGLIAAKDGESLFQSEIDNPDNSENKTKLQIDRGLMTASLKGGDPLQAASMISDYTIKNPKMVYASTKVLFEQGAFDDNPAVKLNAQRFLTAAERTTPGIVDETLVNDYRKAYNDPETQKYMQGLHQYNNTDKAYGSGNKLTVSPVPATTSVPAPAA